MIENKDLFDKWSIGRLTAGLLSGLLGFTFKESLAFTVGYEVLQGIQEAGEPKAESLVNHAGDVGIYLVGFWLGKRWRE